MQPLLFDACTWGTLATLLDLILLLPDCCLSLCFRCFKYLMAQFKLYLSRSSFCAGVQKFIHYTSSWWNSWSKLCGSNFFFFCVWCNILQEFPNGTIYRALRKMQLFQLKIVMPTKWALLEADLAMCSQQNCHWTDWLLWECLAEGVASQRWIAASLVFGVYFPNASVVTCPFICAHSLSSDWRVYCESTSFCL